MGKVNISDRCPIYIISLSFLSLSPASYSKAATGQSTLDRREERPGQAEKLVQNEDGKHFKFCGRIPVL